MSCAAAAMRNVVCRCDPRACASCKSTELAPTEFAKRNAWRYALALRRANKDRRGPAIEKRAPR